MLILSPVSVLELSLLEDICIVVGSCPAMIVESSSGDGGVHQVLDFVFSVSDPDRWQGLFGVTVTVFMGII